MYVDIKISFNVDFNASNKWFKKKKNWKVPKLQVYWLFLVEKASKDAIIVLS